ncbi:hypothetical protein N7517_001143 [Penicillium concentricum]|uniref:Uncharacterized protein n=1 Tax=Penicillium concentricum TaxID=293559 RepID=A0A9W9VIJ9_9EURO|nr:uncharacterized protein N7517_001143 [Penicillium concentricum]KAJ5383232.1 hypothetical protein N7517_001143 [Penicillium concentricum]
MAQGADQKPTLAERVKSFRNIDDQTWPLIILAELDNPSRDELVQRLRPDERVAAHSSMRGKPPTQPTPSTRGNNVQTFTPSISLLASMARQGSHRDSQANLYALAILAYQSGHSKFLVADELSKRQLTGKLRPGEESTLSAILISLNEKPSTPDGISVWARRENCTGQHISQMFAKFEHKWKSMPVTDDAKPHRRGYLSERSIWERPGLEIHDPDRPVLSTDVKTTLGWESHLEAMVAALSRLPVEVATDIVSRIGDAQCLQHTLWKDFPCEEHLVIFLLFHATPDQICQTTSFICEAVRKESVMFKSSETDGSELGEPREPNMTFELIPWDQHGIRSRRDLVVFWLSYYQPHALQFCERSPFLHLLLEPISDVSAPSFVEVSSNNKSVGIASRTTLDILIKAGMKSEPTSDRSHDSYPIIEEENLCHPDQPFCYSFPEWQTASLYRNDWLPAFYLTNHLIKDQDREIRAEIKTFDGGLDEYHETGDKNCGFIPWKTGKAGELDGTVQDIWEIAQKVDSESFEGYDCEFICIDQKSAVDMKVIYVISDDFGLKTGRRKWAQLKDLPNPRMHGITFARIHARDAHVQSCEMPLFTKRAYEYKLQHFIRPDLRPHGRLRWGCDYVDGNGNPVQLKDDVNPEEEEDSPVETDEEDDDGPVHPAFLFG